MFRSMIVLFVFTAAGCSNNGNDGSSNNPGAPSPPGGSSQSCRQLPTSYTTVVDNSTTLGTCTLNASSAEMRCTEEYSDPFGSATIESATTWPSRAAIVDEIDVIPPRTHTTRTVITHDDPGLSSTITYAYDGQGRLTGEVHENPQITSTYTYTAWDAGGRPTAGTVTSTGGGSISLAITNDDAARTRTIVTTPGRCSNARPPTTGTASPSRSSARSPAP